MSAPHIEVKDGKCPHGADVYSARCTACEHFVQSYEDAEKVVEQLSRLVNGTTNLDALATALANEHPTLLGQMAKAMGIGVMRRTLYNPAWKPYDDFGDARLCSIDVQRFPDHPDHDGRFSCELVAGSIRTARQFFV